MDQRAHEFLKNLIRAFDCKIVMVTKCEVINIAELYQ
jgi:hypothetical protein